MEKTKNRISSIDLLRGLVMIIMALDHVRDFFHNDAMVHDPMDLNTTTPVLFFTRWITHYCAPVFVFLSGISAYLSGLRKSKKELSIFLIKRGLWLILIEITVVTFGWTFNPFYNTMVLQVIWAIGMSMIALGLFCRLPRIWILFLALLIICGHNLLDGIETASKGKFGFIWDAFHSGAFSFYPIAPGHGFIIIYPVLPWIGIMLLGFAIAYLFESGFDSKKRKNILLISGILMLLCFVILRFINGYGDKMHWQVQTDSVSTILSFLNVSKYPPSFMFVCLTIGPALIFLAFSGNIHSRFSHFIRIFGKVPFFYYILHIYVIHLLTVILFFISGYGTHEIVSSHSFFNFRPVDFGYELWMVYVIWIFLIFLLYFPCKWYQKYKSTHDTWWLSYL